jgi:zinc/manganese transport system ATP-binding protein
LLQLIDQLQKKYHFTLLITAHDFNPLLYLLDRVMFIGQGKAILDVPDKVIQSQVLSDLYQTSLQVVELNGRKWVLSNEQQAFLNPTEHCHGDQCHV